MARNSRNFVIVKNGAVERNDDNTIMLQVSKAHAERVIRWLGIKGQLETRLATDAEVAQGNQTRMHQRREREIGPGW